MRLIFKKNKGIITKNYLTLPTKMTKISIGWISTSIEPILYGSEPKCRYNFIPFILNAFSHGKAHRADGLARLFVLLHLGSSSKHAGIVIYNWMRGFVRNCCDVYAGGQGCILGSDLGALWPVYVSRCSHSSVYFMIFLFP